MTNEKKVQVKIPEGYIERSSDVVGFWDAELGPVHVIPMHVVFSDSKLDASKASILIHARLVDETYIKGSKRDSEDDAEAGDDIEGKVGDLIGIWYKPGMSAIKDLAGVPTLIYADGEKNTGKPNPMTIFRVLSRTMGKPLTVLSDYRKESLADTRHTKHFTVQNGAGSRLEQIKSQTLKDGDDNFPSNF